MEESNILVAIRVRPLNQKEIQEKNFDVAQTNDNLIIILDPIEMEFVEKDKKMLDVYHRSKEQRYAFDKIYRDHSNDEIYAETCKPLITPVMKGFNATVFAYGPTGTGKTFSMVGNYGQPGLMGLTAADLFEYAKNDQENKYDIKITYVEIYNEIIRDLLVPNSAHLDLREEPLKGITIAGVTEYKVESVSSVMSLLVEGNKRRTTESTNANQTSSRSHAIFQIMVNSCSRVSNTESETLVGKLSLIDLAGSERGTVTENRGIRLREGAKINQSLLALANCINALGDKSKKGYFVPYRDSKLTRVLKDSLGGNSKTVMINCVSPASSQFEETINTLKYANRAKNIKTKATANKKLVSRHIAEYKSIINELRAEIESLKFKLQTHISDGNDTTQDEDPQNNQKQNQQAPPQQQQQVPQQQYQDSQNCICQRSEDEQELKKIQEEIYENFQDRIQFRRGLMEIEEQNAMNILEIKKKNTEVNIWKKMNLNSENGQLDKDKIPEELKQDIRQIRTLKMSTEQNKVKKELMSLQLMENIANAKLIRDKIPQRIKWRDKRNFLELVIKNHVLELQNIELEINLQIQEKTIEDLKSIIDSQRKIIYENDLNNNNSSSNNNQENNNNNMFNNNNDNDVDDIDVDLDELVNEDDMLDEYQQNEIDDGEFYLQQSLTMYKENLQEQESSTQLGENQSQQGKGKNGSKHQKGQVSQDNNNKQMGFEISGQGYSNNNNKKEKPSTNKQLQKKEIGSKNELNSKNNNNKNSDNSNNFSGISITGQGVQQQQNNQNQKGMPQIQKGSNNNKDRESLKDRDISQLNLKGKNLVLPQLGDQKAGQAGNQQQKRGGAKK